jgi:hypothetical protein
MLAELGHIVVGPFARLSRGLEMAQSESVNLAILDVNLDGEKTYPIADALAGRGIPFAFSTGYGKKSLSLLYCDRPTLQKPFQQRDLCGGFCLTMRRGRSPIFFRSPSLTRPHPLAYGDRAGDLKSQGVRMAVQGGGRKRW